MSPTLALFNMPPCFISMNVEISKYNLVSPGLVNLGSLGGTLSSNNSIVSVLACDWQNNDAAPRDVHILIPRT